MDTLGFEPRAFRMRSGCDATTPCAPWKHCAHMLHVCCNQSPVLPQRPVRRTFCYKLHGQLDASESSSPEFGLAATHFAAAGGMATCRSQCTQTRMSDAQWPISARRAQSSNSAAGSQAGLLGESRASPPGGPWELNQLNFGFPSGIIR